MEFGNWKLVLDWDWIGLNSGIQTWYCGLRIGIEKLDLAMGFENGIEDQDWGLGLGI